MWAILGRWLGHWLVYVILTAGVVWVVYAGMIRPITKPNPTQQGVFYTPKVTFGCANFAIPKEK